MAGSRCPCCAGRIRLELDINFLVCGQCCELLYANEVTTWGGLMEHPPMIFVLDVGFTTTRPVRPDEHARRVIVSAHDEHEACLLGALIVGSHREVEMVTSTTITDFWI